MYLQLQNSFSFLSFEQISLTNSSINPCHSLVSAVFTNQPELFLSFLSFSIIISFNFDAYERQQSQRQQELPTAA